MALALLVAGACARPSGGASEGTSRSAKSPLGVEWGGCAAIRKGPVCELSQPRTITIWVAGSAGADWRLLTDRGHAQVSVEPDVDGGTRLTMNVPLGVERLDLGQGGGPAQWSLAIREAEPHREIEELVTLGRSGHHQEAIARLEVLRDQQPPERRGRAEAAIARMRLDLGQVDRAEPAFRAAITAAKVEGRTSDVVRDAAALVWALAMLQQRFADARAVLQDLKAAGAEYPEGGVWIAYHEGLLAAQIGDVRTALEDYREAERKGRRLRITTLADTASMEIARQLAGVGKFDEAIAIFKRLPRPEDPCARSSWLLNVASTLVERAVRAAGQGADPEVTSALAAAEEASRACPDPHRQALATINEAEYALAIGDEPAIARAIRAIESKAPAHDARLASWRSDVFGRWYLRQKRPALALVSFEEQIRVASGVGLEEEQFRGQVGAGRALLTLGRREAGVSRLRAAQALLETMLRDVPLDAGRATFLGGHDEAVRGLVSALVEGGDARAAFRVVRMSRTVELAHAARTDRWGHLSPEARRHWDEAVGRYQRIRREIERQAEDDWSMPRAALARARAERQVRSEEARAALDEAYGLLADHGPLAGRRLSQPAAGEVYVAFFPAPVGWYAFAATPGTVIARRVSEADATTLAQAGNVSSSFDRELSSARRVRVLAYGASDLVDWHMASWRGRPLLSSVDVEYGLDLSSRAGAETPDPGPRTALLVANSGGDLPASTAEVLAVEKQLSGWNVTRLEGRAVTRSSVLDRLAHVGLFHYAGHAEVERSEGLASALSLGGAVRIEIGDLLAASAVPPFVVLSACEAAGTAPRSPSLMGLAQAFIAAGARAVVAPVRRVSDTAALWFFRRFYAAVASGQGDFDAAFRRAFRATILGGMASGNEETAGSRDDSVGWQSFRLLVP
ncbi:MAG TPA: CHAT domain-containing protein [Polyangia bacterium]